MTPADIIRLLELAQKGKTRDLAAYAKEVKAHASIEVEMERLLDKNRQLALTDVPDFEAAARWRVWVQKEQKRLKAVSQILELAKEASRKTAVSSSARVQALEMLLKESRKVELLQNRRRAEQNGVPPDA